MTTGWTNKKDGNKEERREDKGIEEWQNWSEGTVLTHERKKREEGE